MILYLTECLTVLLEYFQFQKLKADLLVSNLATLQNAIVLCTTKISILCNYFTQLLVCFMLQLVFMHANLIYVHKIKAFMNANMRFA